MQTNLEKKAISKRVVDRLANKYDEEKDYDEKGGNAVKGDGVSQFSHLKTPDVNGEFGSDVDKNGAPNMPYSGRVGNVSINKYTPYSDGYNEGVNSIDTSLNKGQIIID